MTYAPTGVRGYNSFWVIYEGNLRVTAERRDGARMGLSERYDTILSRNDEFETSTRKLGTAQQASDF